MTKLDKSIKKIFDQVQLRNGNSSDICTRIINVGQKEIGYIFLESVSSNDKVSDFLARGLVYDAKNTHINLFNKLFSSLENTVICSSIKIVDNYEDVFYYLFSGFTCIFVNNVTKCIVIETKQKLDRGIVESTTETIIRGPKDSFTENHMLNIGLIRKRIKDEKLWFEDTIVGKRTKTKVTITYLQDIVQEKKIAKIRKKLQAIDIDGILDSGYLRSFLANKQTGDFPKMISSERPDLACEGLLNGKIVILVENSPFCLIIPALFVDFFHTPEDNYETPINVTTNRILRFISFFITILTPAIYVALTTYDVKMIPSKLLISIANQRQGVPFPTFFEVAIMLGAFEILRECDIRMPTQMGASVSIVGALVLGEATVAAGVVSPIVVIIVAITSVSGILFSDIDVVNSVRLWRTIFLICGAFLGLIGVVIAGLILITRLSCVTSLGTSFLAPISPFNLSEQKYGILQYSRKKIKKRPMFLHPKDIIRKGPDKNEKN